MTELMPDTITAGLPAIAPTRYAEDVLAELQPPEVAEASLARLAVQRSLRFDFNEEQHIKCARPQRLGRTWAGQVSKVLHQKYGNANGFSPADLEVEAMMLDLDEVIWDAEIQAEKQRIIAEGFGV